MKFPIVFGYVWLNWSENSLWKEIIQNIWEVQNKFAIPMTQYFVEYSTWK